MVPFDKKYYRKRVYSLAMAVYVIVNINIKDLPAYDAYKTGAPPLVKKHGGEYLARGGATEVLEGAWVPNRLAILKFPDLAAVKALLMEPLIEIYDEEEDIDSEKLVIHHEEGMGDGGHVTDGKK